MGKNIPLHLQEILFATSKAITNPIIQLINLLKSTQSIVGSHTEPSDSAIMVFDNYFIY